MSISRRLRYLWSHFQDKEYRHAFVDQTMTSVVAAQIREMREARDWKQAELAQMTGKKQPQISQLEDPNYGSYTLKTLKTLAEAFDVALIVRFAPFSELAGWSAEMNPSSINVVDFEGDVLRTGEINTGSHNIPVDFKKVSSSMGVKPTASDSSAVGGWTEPRDSNVIFGRFPASNSTKVVGR